MNPNTPDEPPFKIRRYSRAKQRHQHQHQRKDSNCPQDLLEIAELIEDGQIEAARDLARRAGKSAQQTAVDEI